MEIVAKLYLVAQLHMLKLMNDEIERKIQEEGKATTRPADLRDGQGGRLLKLAEMVKKNGGTWLLPD